jgi:hypothetical protein
MYRNVTAGAARAGAHANQAQTAAAGGGGAQAAAVILDGQVDFPAARGQFHLHVLRAGVARNVGERFL